MSCYPRYSRSLIAFTTIHRSCSCTKAQGLHSPSSSPSSGRSTFRWERWATTYACLPKTTWRRLIALCSSWSWSWTRAARARTSQRRSCPSSRSQIPRSRSRRGSSRATTPFRWSDSVTIVMRAVNWLLKKVVKVRLQGPIDLQMYSCPHAANRRYCSSSTRSRPATHTHSSSSSIPTEGRCRSQRTSRTNCSTCRLNSNTAKM